MPKYLKVNVKSNLSNAPTDQSPNFLIKSYDTSVDLQSKKQQMNILVYDDAE